MTHRESLELLPWYSSLDSKRRREVEDHLASCEECRRELAEIQSMGATIAPLEEAPEPSPGMWERTMARIDDFESEKTSTRGGVWRWMDWWAFSPTAARTLIAAQAVLIIGLGLGGIYFERQAQYFETLAGANTTTSGAPRLTVAFQPGVSEQTVRETIQKLSGVIVDGPSALGMYMVEIPKGSDANKIVAELEANTTVIRYVQKNPD